MKRLIASLVALAIVITFGIIGHNYVDKTYREITEELTKSEEEVRKGEILLAIEYSKEAERKYVKAEKLLAAFVNHGTLDDIGVDISAVTPLLYAEDKAEFFSHAAQAKVSLEHLKNDVEITVKNLF